MRAVLARTTWPGFGLTMTWPFLVGVAGAAAATPSARTEASAVSARRSLREPVTALPTEERTDTACLPSAVAASNWT